MNTTTKTIRFEFVNGRWSLQNKQYQVYIKNDTGFKKIYDGLTFFNIKGNSEIYLDTILRDLVFRWETTYYEDQLYRPTNFIDDVENIILKPVEATKNQFMTTTVKVTVGDENEQLTKEKEITGLYENFYEETKGKLINPYDATIPATFQNLTTLVKSVPHIPNVSSDKFWLGLNFSVNQQFGNAPLYLKTPETGRRKFEIKREGYGNYACAYSLQELFDNLNSYYLANSITMSQYSIPIPYEGDIEVAKIDVCPADYYVAFTYNYGWSSFGFYGNVYEDYEQNNEKIVNNFDAEEVIWNKTRTRFKLSTGIISKEEYEMLRGILSAYKIYVYDVKKDKGTWCSLVTSNAQGLPNKSVKPKHFTVELIENKFLIA